MDSVEVASLLIDLRVIPYPREGIDVMGMPLSVDEGFFFSLLDGVMTLDEVCAASSKSHEEASRIINKLLELGAIDLLEVTEEDRGHSSTPAAMTEPEKPTVQKNEGELSQALKQEIMGMRLHVEQANYYQMLAVAPNADRKAIRKQYFELSKKFHPDSYFKKDLGRYSEMMEFVFKKITEAYETLSRKKRRARYDEYIVDQIRTWEMERSLAGEADNNAASQQHPPHAHSEAESPQLEVYRFATATQNSIAGAPVLQNAQPGPKQPPPIAPEVMRGKSGKLPSYIPSAAPTRQVPSVSSSLPSADKNRYSPPEANVQSQPSSLPNQPKANVILGPESEVHRKLRHRRGQSVLKTLMYRKHTETKAGGPTTNDPENAFGVKLDLQEPGPGQSTEELLAFRYANAGLEALSLGDLSAAVNAFEVAVQLNPDNEQVVEALTKVRSRAQGALTSSYMRQGEYEEEMGKHLQAATSFLKALQHRSDDTELKHRIAINILKGDGDLKRARGLARSVVGANPQNAGYRATLAEIFLKLGQEQEAIEELREAGRLDPNNERVARLLRGIGREV